MLEEVCRIIDAGPGAVYIDATVGGGGHAERLAEMAGPGGRLLGIDRDPAAIEASRKRFDRFGDRVTLVRARFSELDQAAGRESIPPANGILFDLGFSSTQVDLEQRGFSYHGQVPLDMRMDPESGGVTAAHLLNELPEAELARILTDYGEERWAGRIASFVGAARKRSRIETAEDLVEVIKAAVPAGARRRGPHPARRTFQALRIAVNDELGELERALDQVHGLLAEGGRVVVISYHSLEDRIVKNAFRQAEKGCRCPPGLPECRCGLRSTMKVLTPRPLQPGEEEVAENPRARSAKLRAAQRL